VKYSFNVKSNIKPDAVLLSDLVNKNLIKIGDNLILIDSKIYIGEVITSNQIKLKWTNNTVEGLSLFAESCGIKYSEKCLDIIWCNGNKLRHYIDILSNMNNSSIENVHLQSNQNNLALFQVPESPNFNLDLEQDIEIYYDEINDYHQQSVCGYQSNQMSDNYEIDFSFDIPDINDYSLNINNENVLFCI